MTSDGIRVCCAGLLVLALSACRGNATAIVPASAPNADAVIPTAAQSTLITALFKGKPIANLVITLSRNRKGGPVIGKGRT